MPNRVRVHAEATVSATDPLLGDFPGAQLLVRAKITESFVNCPRYIVNHRRVEASKYVPDDEGDAPLPGWKKMHDIRPFLRPDDQIRAEADGESLTIEAYAELVRRGEA